VALAVAVALTIMPGWPAIPTALPATLWWAACAWLALWLLRWDIAPRQWRREGWLGHTSQCLTLGYLWLLAGALLALGGLTDLLRADGAAGVARHAVLLGFVFAMVFGHAPIILPALARVRPVYTRWARLPIWVLSASLLLRLAASGALHAVAVASFAAVMAKAV
jgi:hypothetical protein